MTIRMLTITTILLLGTGTAFAAPETFRYKSAADVGKSLKDGGNGLSMVQLDNHPDLQQVVANRTQSGQAEVHDVLNDYFVVLSGEGTLVYGGKVNGSKQTAPGEWRGTSISGGKVQKLMSGDLITIPAGMPHQVQVANGKAIRYLVLKNRK